MTNTPAVSVENCDDVWVTIQSTQCTIQTCIVGADHFGVNRRRCSKQGRSTGQATMVGKMVLASARDKMKRTGRCGDMHDVQCGGSPGYLARRNKTTGSGRACRVRSQGYTIRKISCARSTHEDEGYLQIVTSKSTDLVVRSDTTDGTPDADPGFSSDMMAKPQSVVKLRRFGALLNEVVQRLRDCITRSYRCSASRLWIERCVLQRTWLQKSGASC